MLRVATMCSRSNAIRSAVDTHCNLPAVLFSAAKRQTLSSIEVNQPPPMAVADDPYALSTRIARLFSHIPAKPARRKAKDAENQEEIGNEEDIAGISLEAVLSVSSDPREHAVNADIAQISELEHGDDLHDDEQDEKAQSLQERSDEHKPLSRRVFSAFGVHPLYCSGLGPDSPEVGTDLRRFLGTPSCVALGEAGLDFHDFGPDSGYASRETQIPIFVAQMALAVELNLPLIVHTREAEADTLSLMKEHLPRDHMLHVHCFTGSVEFMHDLLGAFSNLFIGFAGVVSFRRGAENVRQAAVEAPLNRLLLETDAPFMSPEPFRGLPCQPRMLGAVARAVADVRGENLDELLLAVRANTTKLFGI